MVQKKTTLSNSSPHQTGKSQARSYARAVELSTVMKTCVSEVELWDVIAELVQVSTCPSPANPFAVDLDYFESLPPAERVLASSAMLSFLECVIKSDYHHYNNKGWSHNLDSGTCVRCLDFLQLHQTFYA